MDTFAPEFSRFWLPIGDRDGQRITVRNDEKDADMRRQQQALEELAERVNAARSVV